MTGPHGPGEGPPDYTYTCPTCHISWDHPDKEELNQQAWFHALVYDGDPTRFWGTRAAWAKLKDGEWHNYAMTWTPGGSKHYIDGDLIE